MMLNIAIRNIFRHRVRSTITLSTIAFGCVAVIFVGGFFQDIFDKIREGFIGSQSGHIQIYRRGFIQEGRIEPYKYLIDNSEEIKAMVRSIPEVKYVAARLQFPGLMSTGGNTVSFVGQGIEPDKEISVPHKDVGNIRELMNEKYSGIPIMESGFALSAKDSYEVVLGKGLAQSMGVTINSPIVLLASTVAGSTNALDLNIKGTFLTSQKEFDDLFLRVPLSTAQSLLNTHSVQNLVVKLNQTADTAKVYEQLKGMVEEKHWDLELRRWEDMADNYNKTVELFNMFYLILWVVIGIVIVLGIFNTMNMSVMERFSEIGTIMALGIRRSGVMKQFLLEGLLLGAVGGVIGVAAGTATVSIISAVGIEMPPPPGGTFNWLTTPHIVPSALLTTFVMSIIMGGISSLYPAYKASRLQIIEALRYR